MNFLLTTIIAVSCLSMQAPKPEELSNSKWSGTLNVPHAIAVEMEFKKDSLFTYMGEELLETNSFQIKGDTLVLQKLSGRSSCDLLPAHYKYIIKDDILKIEALNDGCSERKDAFSPEGYKRMK